MHGLTGGGWKRGNLRHRASPLPSQDVTTLPVDTSRPSNWQAQFVLFKSEASVISERPSAAGRGRQPGRLPGVRGSVLPHEEQRPHRVEGV